MAAPVFGGAEITGVNQGTSSVSVAAPSGVSSGDYQLVAVAIVTDSIDFGSTPSGWTQLVNLVIPYNDSATDSRLGVYESTSATDAFSMTLPQSRVWCAARCYWTLPEGSSGRTASPQTTTTSASTSHALPSATTTAADSLVIGIAASETNNQGQAWTGYGSATQRARQDNINTIECIAIGVGELAVPTPTSGVTTSFTCSVSQEAGLVSIVIDGAGGGGGAPRRLFLPF